MIKKLLTFIFIFFFANVWAQTIKVDMDSVIVYCKYSDLMKSIKKVGNYSQSTEWVPTKWLLGTYKKKIVDRSKPWYVDSISVLKTISGDTIFLTKDFWCYDMIDETSRLAEKNKLIFFDKRNNKKVVQVKKIVTGTKGAILFYEFVDYETKNKLYKTIKTDWAKF